MNKKNKNIIENIIKDAEEISNAEVLDVYQDKEVLIITFNDYLNKGDEFLKDIKYQFIERFDYFQIEIDKNKDCKLQMSVTLYIEDICIYEE